MALGLGESLRWQLLLLLSDFVEANEGTAAADTSATPTLSQW